VRELDALAKSLRQGGVKVRLQSTHAARAWGCLTRGTPCRTVLDDCRSPSEAALECPPGRAMAAQPRNAASRQAATQPEPCLTLASQYPTGGRRPRRLSLCRQGIACNMARPGDVAALANFARDKLGSVDLWCALPRLHGSRMCERRQTQAPCSFVSERGFGQHSLLRGSMHPWRGHGAGAAPRAHLEARTTWSASSKDTNSKEAHELHGQTVHISLPRSPQRMALPCPALAWP